MCMGCAGIAMMNSDGKTPDTTETIFYFGLFALWIMVLVHLKKSPNEQGAETRFSMSAQNPFAAPVDMPSPKASAQTPASSPANPFDDRDPRAKAPAAAPASPNPFEAAGGDPFAQPAPRSDNPFANPLPVAAAPAGAPNNPFGNPF